MPKYTREMEESLETEYIKTDITSQHPSLVSKQDIVEHTNTSNMNTSNPSALAKPVLDPTTQKTILDSGSESDSPFSWGTVANTILLPVSDENIAHIPVNAKKIKKRSPNRDDSDSEDEDEDGNKIPKAVSDTPDEEGFNPLTDPDFLNSGFKVGFSEDRNKRFRRTMEVFFCNKDAHTICLNFNNISGCGSNLLPRILCCF